MPAVRVPKEIPLYSPEEMELCGEILATSYIEDDASRQFLVGDLANTAVRAAEGRYRKPYVFSGEDAQIAHSALFGRLVELSHVEQALSPIPRILDRTIYDDLAELQQAS